MSDIATRMNRSASYVQTYKKRLLEQGAIVEVRRGAVAFGIPFMREFLERE